MLVIFYAFFCFTSINTAHIRRDNNKSIINSGHVFTFVASDKFHSYISQLEVFHTAFIAK
jgi:hypothetical protein